MAEQCAAETLAPAPLVDHILLRAWAQCADCLLYVQTSTRAVAFDSAAMAQHMEERGWRAVVRDLVPDGTRYQTILCPACAALARVSA